MMNKPKFKVGDRIVGKITSVENATIINVDRFYTVEWGSGSFTPGYVGRYNFDSLEEDFKKYIDVNDVWQKVLNEG
jgi:hypothetical protein